MSAIATSKNGEQHLKALARANEVRLARAGLKRRLASGETGAAEVMLECPWEAASMAVADVLKSQPRWGGTRCRKLLSALRITETKTVGALTQRQRRQLADTLG